MVTIAERLDIKSGEDTVLDAIEKWANRKHYRRHCSNCRWAIVYGSPSKPLARCRKDFGYPVFLYEVIRTHSPHSFSNPNQCSQYSSMDDID
jgi:hypothetical protein